MAEYSLTSYGHQALSHWQQHRPKMYRRLQLNGQLKKAALDAQEKAKTRTADLVRAGSDLDSAREAALREFVLLPSESEEPMLDPDRMPYGQPDPTIG